ncbi:serine hydrolase domain-containing protein [Maribacter sp. CXY002]|uniref:serine hydrolase domain-containing protein n=1 Tax=Maribacter luteocoastalis TaxID=3407671 RepID=UPI003B671EAB
MHTVPNNINLLLKNLIEEKKVPGLAISVWKDGDTIFQKGYGYANLETEEPVLPKKTIFRIASISKPIAATALAHMVIDGLIDLDASFYDYVPYYPKKKWDFTIRQLAGHTAGIRGYRGIEYGLNKTYTIKESIALFKDDDLLFKPGTGYMYTSFDWVLISLAMQEVSGISFKDYVQEKVLIPLSMKSTIAPPVSGVLHNEKVTAFYSKGKLGFRKAIPVNNYYKLAGGGFLSTAEDITKLGTTYLNKLLSQEIYKNQFLKMETVAGKPTYYGLGWQVSLDSKGRNFYGHIGNAVGGYSNFFIYPDEKMVFTILINCTDPKIQPELDEVVNLFIEESLGNLSPKV